MNVFRSLARNLFDFMDVRAPARQPGQVQRPQDVRAQRVQRAYELAQYRDGFEQMPQKLSGALRTLSTERAFRPQLNTFRADGFEASAARRRPVDLSGGVKPAPVTVPDEKPAANAPAAGFLASLDDLGALE